MRSSLTVARLLTLLFFLLLVSICSYWALQILAPRPAIAPSASIGDTAAAPNLSPAISLFGSVNAVTAGAPVAPSNIQVSGIAEAGPEGVVILSVDGKPGAAYGINENVTDGTTVKSVGLDKVVLNQRGRLIELKTPERSSRDVLSSGIGKPRAASDSSTAAPVPARAVAPAPLPSPPARPPQLQPPQPPQQQQLQQQQAQQQQLQQQQLQQQQALQLQQQQQQQQQQQPLQQQPLQQQQAQGQGQAPGLGQAPGPGQAQGQPQLNPQYQGGGAPTPGMSQANPMLPGGSQPMQGSGQGGAFASTAVSGQQQVAPGQQVVPGQQIPGQQIPGQQIPGQPLPGQPSPGQPSPGQPSPAQQMPGQPPAPGQQANQ